MKFHLLIFMLFLVLPAHAHHVITGVILDADDHVPLAGATIRIENSNTGTVSNEFGQFKLTVESDEVVLIISFIGYSEKRIQVSAHDTNLRIMLKPSTIELDQLSIIAGGINSINNVSRLDLNLRPVNSSQDVLRIVPGYLLPSMPAAEKQNRYFSADSILITAPMWISR